MIIGFNDHIQTFSPQNDRFTRNARPGNVHPQFLKPSLHYSKGYREPGSFGGTTGQLQVYGVCVELEGLEGYFPGPDCDVEGLGVEAEDVPADGFFEDVEDRGFCHFCLGGVRTCMFISV